MMSDSSFIKPIAGFTLIELLISVSISAILMTGILIFVSSSLGSNAATKQSLEKSSTNAVFERTLLQTVADANGIYASGSSFSPYLTGLIFQTRSPNLPATFVGIKTETGYCDSFSGSATESGTVQKLVVRQFVVPTVQNNSSYTLSSSGNVILS